MIPTEKAVLRKIFVCYVYNLFVYVLTAYGCTYKITVYKQRKLVRFHRVLFAETLKTHNNNLAFEIRYYYANS